MLVEPAESAPSTYHAWITSPELIVLVPVDVLIVVETVKETSYSLLPILTSLSTPNSSALAPATAETAPPALRLSDRRDA